MQAACQISRREYRLLSTIALLYCCKNRDAVVEDSFVRAFVSFALSIMLRSSPG
jgi:hypothetical protein